MPVNTKFANCFVWIVQSPGMECSECCFITEVPGHFY